MDAQSSSAPAGNRPQDGRDSAPAGGLLHRSAGRTLVGESSAVARSRGPFGGTLTTFLVLAAPALWLGLLIYRYGVDFPWGDQWDATYPLFEKMAAGTLGIGDFFKFHNEHRIVFPRLVAFAVGNLTHWNVRAELLVIWLLVCACSLNLWGVVRTTSWRDHPSRHWLLLATNVLLFSPLQWENLLWGFQIGFLLPLATMTACLWTARFLPQPFNFLAGIGLCLISTFSIASGFASWFITTPLLLLSPHRAAKRGQNMWWWVWITVAIASIYFYFQGLSRPAGHPSPTAALEQPFAALQFLLAYLGVPFCYGTAFDRAVVAQIAGAALVLLLLGCVAYLWHGRRDQALIASCVPWLALASIALVNAALTAVGRCGFGINAALQSRYVSFAVLLPIALLFLIALVVRDWRQRLSAPATSRVAVACASGFTAMALLLSGATLQSLEQWSIFQHYMLNGKAVLFFLNVLDDPKAVVQYVHGSHWAMKEWTANLDRIGYLHPSPLQSANIREIASDPGDELMGTLDRFVRTRDGGISASGWAFLPGSGRVADSVLLAYEDAEKQPIVFARVDVDAPRPDISEWLHDRAYARSGWTFGWDPEQLPPGTQRITAWAFDAEECRAFLIGSGAL